MAAMWRTVLAAFLFGLPAQAAGQPALERYEDPIYDVSWRWMSDGRPVEFSEIAASVWSGGPRARLGRARLRRRSALRALRRLPRRGYL